MKSISLTIEEGEYWWGGAVADSVAMPFDRNSNYSMNLYGCTRSGQAQPILISSKGRAIWSDDPFRFSIADGQLTVDSLCEVLYSSCEGDSLRSAFQILARDFYSSYSEKPDEQAFAGVTYNTLFLAGRRQNQDLVLNFADDILKHGFPPGVILISDGWQRYYGNWRFDRNLFPDPAAMVSELKSKGFRVILWVSPFVSPDSPAAADLEADSLLVCDGSEELHIPSMNDTQINDLNTAVYNPLIVRWRKGASAMLDLTCEGAINFLKQQLDDLVFEYNIDGFDFEGVNAMNFTANAVCDVNIFPNTHLELFNSLGLDYKISQFIHCWKMGGLPLIQRQRPGYHCWEDLQSVIPNALLQNLEGFYYASADFIGGGAYDNFLTDGEVDHELFIRFSQCAALLPVMQFALVPWNFLKPDALKICRAAVKLHLNFSHIIAELIENAAVNHEPPVRNLEYNYPNCGYATITDQFMLGEKVLVAPVLQKHAATREVVLPPGEWTADDGICYQGAQTIKVDAPLERLPHFIRRS